MQSTSIKPSAVVASGLIILAMSHALLAAEVPYVPSAAAVSVTVTIEGSVRARVKVRLPTPCHHVGNWGTPARTGSMISVDAQFLVDPGLLCVQVISEQQTEYDLGPLPPGSYQFVFKVWGQRLMAKDFSVNPPPSAGQGFYRIVAEAPTRITSFDRDGMLLATGGFPNTSFTIETASELAGRWTADFSYTVLANANGQLAALVPLGSGPPVRPVCGRPNWIERIYPSVPIGKDVVRLDAYVWRNLMPGPPPVAGVLTSITIASTGEGLENGAITRIWVINGADVWDVSPPFEASPSAPGTISAIVSGGPLWPPGAEVDVVVQVTFGRVSYLLRAANETIEPVF